MAGKIIRIGGASGFWGDAANATPQLLGDGNLDYIVYDYLAEITMSIMARARAKSPDLGYAVDFVTTALKPNLKEIARQGVKVISNAGGVNVAACAQAVRETLREQGLDLKVAVVTGDDLSGRLGEIAADAPTDMFSGAAFPDPKTIASVNAYLGAFPIARALDEGADIVITGRCVDSAVTLGACIHEFGWKPDDPDRLAGGSLAGHVLECGPQATGGNFTDWELSIERLDEIGYPIAEVGEDGAFACTKPEGTGGLVNVGTVGEQMLYEIGDPQAYILPDVVCDFSGVKLTQEGPDRVRVEGAKGLPAPDTYKVCATFTDGFRGGTSMTFYGIDAERKAEKFADRVLARARRTLGRFGAPDYTDVSVEIIGAESQFGSARRIENPREVNVKLAVKHPSAEAVGLLLREVVSLGLATPPGLSHFAGTRPKPSPVVRLFSFKLPRTFPQVRIEMDGRTISYEDAGGQPFDRSAIARPEPPAEPSYDGEMETVPLIALAWGRSGDKGNDANVGILARKPEYLPYIYHQLTEEGVAKRFAHFLEGSVERFLLPGPPAINFLLHDVLGGGGVASLRNDPQGKGYAQLLLDYPIEIPAAMAEALD